MTARPRLLDLFCGAGGAAMGYHRAGFEVVGVDIAPQKHYPFEFIQDDALNYLDNNWWLFDAYHASPPCQKHSKLSKGLWSDRWHPDYIDAVRGYFIDINKTHQTPWVIENVVSAPLINPVELCGTMFRLQTVEGNQLHRHRWFEMSFWTLTPPCAHNGEWTVGVYGHAGGSSRRNERPFFAVEKWREAMRIDWMVGEELAEAIPPAYTEFIGARLMEYLR